MRIDVSTMNNRSSIKDGHDDCQTELVTKTAQKNVVITPVRRRSSLLKRSNSGVKRRKSRTSRRNDRPVIGSPMLDASECYSCPIKDLSLGDCKEEDPEGSFLEEMFASEGNTDNDKHNEFNRIIQSEREFQQHHAKQQVESTKEFMARRLNRVNMKFFKQNPSKKVPKFNRSELSLGGQLGEGEFGSVFSVESFTRQDSSRSSFIILDEHRDSNNSINSTTPGESRISSSLDDFIQKWHKILDGQDNEPTESKVGNHENSINEKEDSNFFSKTKFKRSSESLRISSHLKDRKNSMIHRQNSAESFDGYAVKLLRADITNENVKSMAAFDMITEAKILSSLSHPNIIHIRGVMGCVELGNYGIIMDKLSSTLQDQIHKWARYTTEGKVRNKAPGRHRVLEHVPKWMLVRQHEKDKQKTCLRETEFFVERMEAVLDVSNAMGYLHENHIVFRDLKPENVGLANDSYVLFDFGLARELKESDRVGSGEDSYRATGLTGSRLFMSPEVAMKKPYGFSSDVYSFAILFWEVVALREVFSNMTMSKHYHQVIVKGKRPSSMEDVLPPELDDMMVASWDKNPTNRPSFEYISKTLVQELDKIGSKKFGSSLMSFSHNTASLVHSKEFGSNAKWDDVSTPGSRSSIEKLGMKRMSKKNHSPLLGDRKMNKKSGLSSTDHEKTRKTRKSKVTAFLESSKKSRTSKSVPTIFRSSVTWVRHKGKDQDPVDDKA